MAVFGDVVSIGASRAFKERETRRISDVKPLRSTAQCKSMASLTRVLTLRCTLAERIKQWAQWAQASMEDFERNSRMAAIFYMRNMGYEAASENDAADGSSYIEWDGGPKVRAGIVARLIPDVVTESWLLDGDPATNAEMVLTECLHMVFEDVYDKIDEIREECQQELKVAGGNLAALCALTEKVDCMGFANIPSPTELARDLLLGFASSRGMHIRGSRASFAQDGRFYTSLELCPVEGMSAQRICLLLNGLINIEEPAKCRELLREVEMHRP